MQKPTQIDIKKQNTDIKKPSWPRWLGAYFSILFCFYQTSNQIYSTSIPISTKYWYVSSNFGL